MCECSDPPAATPVIVPPFDRPASLRDVAGGLARPSVRMRRCAARERIFQAGAPVDTVFELVAGFAVVTASHRFGRHRVVDFVRPGRLFGFTAETRHRCTAVAATGSIVCCLDLATARLNGRVAARLDLEMRAEIDRLRELAALLGRGSALARIATLFASMTDPHAPTRVHLPVRRGEIADLLGLTVETVSRNLARLKRDGLLVETEDGVWRLTDPRRLARLAGAPA